MANGTSGVKYYTQEGTLCYFQHPKYDCKSNLTVSLKLFFTCNISYGNIGYLHYKVALVF